MFAPTEIEYKIITLAKALNMHPQTLSNELNGTRSFSLQDAWWQIAKYFQVPTDKILGAVYGVIFGLNVEDAPSLRCWGWAVTVLLLLKRMRFE